LLLFQDTDGKIIGQCSAMKTATLEEGSRLFVGSKEVEVTPEPFCCMIPDLYIYKTFLTSEKWCPGVNSAFNKNEYQ
jgi:hypothetical protein